MSTILGIDTASTDFALAVAEHGVVVRSLVRDGAQDHSRLLLAAISELLDGKQIDGIVVVRGPGSYAGLRVGLATAQGLALARNVPITGVGTMEAAFAASSLREATVIHPAGRGNFAAQQFRDGTATGDLWAAPGDELRGRVLAGEGAGALGGVEVLPEARCRAALSLGLAHLPAGHEQELEAVYLREPNITTPRPNPAAARLTG